MGTLMIEQEYWTVQYLTNVAGEREKIFWPLDGDGKYGSEAAATDRAGALLDTYPSVRVVHVVKRERFGQPLTRVLDASDTER